ncbi:hypothetical protein N8Z80_02440 [Litorivicinus sp.]|nr:hypothetical protein [Litorivicinus sp.]MDC1239878.1 hypothetical protein [Litorivicinus sp.]
MYKILILTDSAANPRTFPAIDSVSLEETYPYLIRSEFRGSTFWQLSIGNTETEILFSQAIGYLSNWEPDFIIIHSGLADCRPEAFSELQKVFISKILPRHFSSLRRNLYNPKLIAKRQVYRVSKRSFRKTVKKFSLIFKDAKIFWLEIVAEAKYENERPGVAKRIRDYNSIIEENISGDLIEIMDPLLKTEGFNNDGIHWNKSGHKVVSGILLDKIKAYLKNKT